MSLRVVAGSAGGLHLKTPKGVTLRPTQDRIKQAMFSSLGARVPGARVLDLYAGTGALGIEALSRGAREAVFVEKERNGCRTITENLAHCRLETQGQVIQADALSYLRGTPRPFDLIFADPPYEKEAQAPPSPLPGLLRPWLAPGGAFIWEFFSGRDLPDLPGWTPLFHRRYGETTVAILTS
ncbi:MAG: 16S rRNA (guanine(966)-N(2))-methyltransferase RsmD [Verrucomicrobium sp.]|nr:16S rRNA (guanine(966)-N(2))-methyltransferase RsmD [Verrucomicrobium sp.]